MSVLLLNTETGERRIVHDTTGTLKAPWRVEKRVSNPAITGQLHLQSKLALEAKLATWASSLGLPVSRFLDAARWLLKKDCPFCQLGTQVLRRVEELGKEKTEELIRRILEAKKENDLKALQQLQEEFKKL